MLTPVDPYPVVINPLPGDAGVANDFDLLHFEPNAEITLMRADAIGTAGVGGCPGLDLDLENPVIDGLESGDASVWSAAIGN